MSKELQLLKSKLEYCKRLINELDKLSVIYNSINFDNKIEVYQNELSKIYKIIKELKEVEE